jgi:hypothetical protein
MQTTKLLFLVLAFLTAILIQLLMTRVENFEAAKRTPLTAENVQGLLDDLVRDFIAFYQKLQKQGASTKDKRIQYRLVDIGDAINNLNYQYPAIQNTIKTLDYTQFQSISLEEVKLIKDFCARTIGLTAESSIRDSAKLADLDMFSNRLQSLFGILQQKAAGVRNSADTVGQMGNTVRIVLENIKKLKIDLSKMKPEDIPVLRADLYVYTFMGAAANFTVDPNLAMKPVPTLEMNNLPAAKSTAAAILSVITASPVVTEKVAAPTVATAATPSSAPAPAAVATTPTGMKFSELIQTLMSYGPVQAGPESAVLTPLSKSHTSTAADLLKTPYGTTSGSKGSNLLTGTSTKYGSSNVPVEDIKKTIREEIQAALGIVKKGPKDDANTKLEDRSTETLKPQAASKPISDSLAQGSWFRNASEEGCPYAMGQQADPNAQPVPFPIDMNDYVRKDSIPCWACNLK